MSRKLFFLIFVFFSVFIFSSNAEEPWGKVKNGVKTRLTCLDGEYTIGKPIRLKLELMNVGEVSVMFDSQQVGVNRSFRVIDNNGKEVPYISASFQTTGSAKSLGPNERVVLLSDFDINKQYLFVSPGKYSITFRGRAGDKLMGDAKKELGYWLRDTIDIPQSNTITIYLKPAQPSPNALLVEKLSSILPEDWELGGTIPYTFTLPDGSKLEILNTGIITGRAGKSSSAGIELNVFSRKRENLDSDFVKRYGLHQDGSYLGKTSLGYVYWLSYGNINTLWPNAENQIRRALGITD